MNMKNYTLVKSYSKKLLMFSLKNVPDKTGASHSPVAADWNK